jgi:hypothetical protein
VKNYEFVFTQFQEEFGDRLIDAITPVRILRWYLYRKEWLTG